MKSRFSSSKTVADFVDSLVNGDVVFLDCGANDGCSAIKYLSEHPTAKVLSFEPNPNLVIFHSRIPNRLVKCAVGAASGSIELLLDTVDADGSTTIKSKQVDFTRQIANKDCPRVEVECVQLSEIIDRIASVGAIIDLKLDVEGAEYEIIKSLLDSSALRSIRKFYCEFHWDRIGMERAEHDETVYLLNSNLKSPVEDWDAVDWMMVNLNGKAKSEMKNKRRRALFEIYLRRLLRTM
jgi:FkbM family methyltransferase